MRSPSPNKSALRSLLALFAVAALGLGWFGLHASGGGEPLASVPIPLNAPENLPDTHAEWRGRIAYPRLDRQLSAMSTQGRTRRVSGPRGWVLLDPECRRDHQHK